jgi:hypothetical protein
MVGNHEQALNQNDISASWQDGFCMRRTHAMTILLQAVRTTGRSSLG